MWDFFVSVGIAVAIFVTAFLLKLGIPYLIKFFLVFGRTVFGKEESGGRLFLTLVCFCLTVKIVHDQVHKEIPKCNLKKVVTILTCTGPDGCEVEFEDKTKGVIPGPMPREGSLVEVCDPEAKESDKKMSSND